MAVRKGSLSGELATLDPELVALLLADYKLAKRRAHCSRADFAAGYAALARRLRSRDSWALKIVTSSVESAA